MKSGCLAYLEWVKSPCWEAARQGITTEHHVIDNKRGRRSTLDVIFRDDSGRVLLHWWPGNGTVKVGGVRHFAATPEAALELAIRQHLGVRDRNGGSVTGA
jgi:hypothetical protein